MGDNVGEEVKTEPRVDENGQAQLIPDDITEEEETREILVPMQPHEVLEIVDRMATMNEELKGHKSDEEKEKARHKEQKEAIAGRISTVTENISKLIDQAGMRKRKSLEKTIKRTNHTAKMVEWIFEGNVVDSRPMVAAEFQLKLLPDQPQDNVVPIEECDAGGIDPSTFDEQPEDNGELSDGIDEGDDDAS